MLTAYADYTFYKDMYVGNKIPEPEFDALALKATYFVNMLTFNRIDPGNVPDEVKMAMCAAAEVILKQDESGGKSSESVGKLAVTYDTRKTAEKKMSIAVQPYLADTGLLYKGAGKWLQTQI